MENGQPLVSIVVCSFMGEQFLAQQLESLLQQSHANLQVIICDDRSTDGTVDIAKSFAEKDKRVELHVNEQNLGYNRNFEKGFSLASGNYIAVCDQDDIWKKDKIEKLLSLFSSPETLLAYSQSVRFTDTIPAITHVKARRQFEGNDVKKIMFFNTVAGHNMMFRKKLLSFAAPFPADVFYDWWLLLCAAIYGTVSFTDEVLTFHRFHTSNLTLGKKDEKKQTREKADERLRTIKRVLSLPGLQAADHAFGEKLESSLSTLSKKRFSPQLFYFLLQNANTIFFFKKKSWLSRAKMAYRLSFAE